LLVFTVLAARALPKLGLLKASESLAVGSVGYALNRSVMVVRQP